MFMRWEKERERHEYENENGRSGPLLDKMCWSWLRMSTFLERGTSGRLQVKELMTTKETAGFFQVSERTIRRWRHKRLLPCVLIGTGKRKTVRFRLEDLRRVAADSASEPLLSLGNSADSGGCHEEA